MIELVEGDITRIKCDAIVNPANSLGTMGGGVALAIKKAGGSDIEKETMSKSPIPVGYAIATSAGRLPAEYVIHAATMKTPVQRTDVRKVSSATKAALDLAASMKIRTIAFPGMGTGTGHVKPLTAAKAMLKEIKKADSDFDKITIVANGELYEAFERELSR